MVSGLVRGVLFAAGFCGASVLTAPARADEPVVKSGTAVGGTTSATPEGKATVAVRSTGAPVTVAVITDRSTGVGNVGGNSVVVMTVHYQDVCQSPCSFELDPGLRELAVHGDGVSSSTKQFQLRPGAQQFVVKPGSAALAAGGYMLVVLGGVAAIVGGTFLVVLPDSGVGLPLTIGGGVGLGAGIGMWIAGDTSFEPEPTQRALRAPTLNLRGSF